jgi:hypothetical protein
MQPSTQALLERIRQLPSWESEQLFQALGQPAHGVSVELLAELRRRLAEIDAGQVELISEEDADARAEAILMHEGV